MNHKLWAIYHILLNPNLVYIGIWTINPLFKNGPQELMAVAGPNSRQGRPKTQGIRRLPLAAPHGRKQFPGAWLGLRLLGDRRQGYELKAALSWIRLRLGLGCVWQSKQLIAAFTSVLGVAHHLFGCPLGQYPLQPCKSTRTYEKILVDYSHPASEVNLVVP